jgi:Ca-activated chloride channel family protein
MKALFEKLESPVVTGLSADLPQGADATPRLLPDLYRGEPLVIAAKLAAAKGTVEIKGMIGDRPWAVRLPLDKAADGQGLSKLWARRKIDDAEVGRTLGTVSADAADHDILALALEHHLVTRLTSLVAVDRTPSRPAGAELTLADIPLDLPAGWDFDKVFGKSGDQAPAREPDAVTPGQRKAAAETMTRLASIAQAPKPVSSPSPGMSVKLPQTATDAELRLYAGLVLLALALVWLGLTGRRRERLA